jgi:hypothetical protein
VGKSANKARALAALARRRRAARRLSSIKAARTLEELADRCERVIEQITKRVRGEKITDRLAAQ